MKITAPHPAIDFEGLSLQNRLIKLSDYKGQRLLLSFFRNGACAMCNLRVRELINRYHEFAEAGIKIIGIFESSQEEMMPYVGQQPLPFDLIADPKASIYDLYRLETSEEKINHVIKSGIAEERIKEAAANGFALTKQEGSNFFRLPADFVIDEAFVIRKAHYSNYVIDHLDVNEILKSF